MSILNRLNRLIRANVNDALDGSGRSSRRAQLRDMRESLREARREQAKLRRNESKIIDAIHEARDEADEWERRALLALENDDESLARQALKQKNLALREAQQLREDLDEHRSHIEDIERSLEALELKLDNQRDDSGSRRPRSEQSGSSDSLENRETFETFDRMAGKINSMEAEADAMRELSEDLSGERSRSELEDRFQRLERKDRSSSRRDTDEAADGGRSGDAGTDRDDLADKKRRMDRLSELKDKFDEDDES
jgi:phage shock protein A